MSESGFRGFGVEPIVSYRETSDRETASGKRYFQKCIRSGEGRGDPRQPVFPGDRFSRSREVFGREKARGRGKLLTRDFSSHGTWRDLNPRIVANALDLPHLADGHDVELAVFFPEPHWSGDARSGLAKRCQGNIFATLDQERD